MRASGVRSALAFSSVAHASLEPRPEDIRATFGPEAKGDPVVRLAANYDTGIGRNAFVTTGRVFETTDKGMVPSLRAADVEAALNDRLALFFDNTQVTSKAGAGICLGCGAPPPAGQPVIQPRRDTLQRSADVSRETRVPFGAAPSRSISPTRSRSTMRAWSGLASTGPSWRRRGSRMAPSTASTSSCIFTALGSMMAWRTLSEKRRSPIASTCCRREMCRLCRYPDLSGGGCRHRGTRRLDRSHALSPPDPRR